MSYKNYLAKEVVGSVFGSKPSKQKIGDREVLDLSCSKEALIQAIQSGQSFAFVKIGEAELACLDGAMRLKEGISKTFNDKVRTVMKETAGFYPTTDRHLLEYADMYLNKLPSASGVGVLGLKRENYFVSEYAKESLLLDGNVLNPLIGGWSHALAGKKVLVVHPFIDDIEFQYRRREKIFEKSPQILPEFDLKLLASPITMGEVVDERFPSFMRALEEIEGRIAQIDFDVALIGCGAYGSLLSLYCKSVGKSAIQTGGSTQLLFGILGSRWEKTKYVEDLMNEYWIRPAVKPQGYMKVAGGAYW